MTAADGDSGHRIFDGAGQRVDHTSPSARWGPWLTAVMAHATGLPAWAVPSSRLPSLTSAVARTLTAAVARSLPGFGSRSAPATVAEFCDRAGRRVGRDRGVDGHADELTGDERAQRAPHVVSHEPWSASAAPHR